MEYFVTVYTKEDADGQETWKQVYIYENELEEFFKNVYYDLFYGDGEEDLEIEALSPTKYKLNGKEIELTKAMTPVPPTEEGWLFDTIFASVKENA